MTRSDVRTTAIAALLDGSGLSDHAIANELGIHPSLMSRYRSGDRPPSKRHTVALCEFFGCTAAQLLGEVPTDRFEAADADDWID